MALPVRWVVAGALPLIFLAGLLMSDAGTRVVVDHLMHTVLIILASLMLATLGLLLLEAFLQEGQVRELGLCCGFLAFGAVYVWHGIYTGAEPAFQWLIYGPPARVLLAAGLLTMAARGRIPVQLRTRYAGLVMLGGVSLAVLGWLLGPVVGAWALRHDPGDLEVVRVALESVALALTLVATATLWFAHKAGRGLPGQVGLGIILVIQQSLFFLLAKPWDLVWWTAHALGAAGTGFMAVGILVVARNTRVASEMERLRQDDAARQAFLNNAAHALRTPLTTLTLNLHTLERLVQDQRGQRTLASARRAAKRLQDLGEELLVAAVAGSDEPALYLEREDVDLRWLVAGVVDAFQDRAKAQGVELALHGEPSPANVDPARVTEVVFALVENALQFTHEGSIDVSVGPHHGGVVLTVRDTGVGLSREEGREVFRPFSRPHEARSSRTEGVGLSLAMAHGVVKAHRGSIEVRSEGPGKGATFRVFFP